MAERHPAKPPVTTADSAAAQQLRQQAEEIVNGRPEAPSVVQETLSAVNADKLLYELRVHQIELEMQNEELRQAQKQLEVLRARYFDLYDLAPVGYLTLDANYIIQDANMMATQMLATVRNQLIKQPFSRFILPEDQDVFYAGRQQLRVTAQAQPLDLRLYTESGKVCWVHLDINRMQHERIGDWFRVVMIDITSRKQDELCLRQAAAMFESAREGMMVTDADEMILLVNRALCELSGYTAEDVLGKTPRLFQSGRQSDKFYADMWAAIEASGHWQGEVWNRRKSGEIYPQLLSITAVKDEKGKVALYVGVFSDISQLKEAAKKLDYLAHHDPLTRLPNRLLLFARLEHSLETAIRDRKSLALLMLDLDRFKDINDSYGHLAGDELLQQVAVRLSGRLRGIDTITRLGGDEFAVLLEDLSHPQDAALVAEDIIESLNQPWRLSMGVEVRISTSIGISLCPQHSKTSEELLQQADAALYLAKAEGRGNFKYFSEDLTQAARRRLNLEALLRRALTNQELQVYYQPQVELASGRIVGAEALLRWSSPSEGMISPDQFIPVAEETGLIDAIGVWALRQACIQGQTWLADGLPPLNLAVNVSSHQFRHGDLCQSLATILSETGYPAEQLELELTESTLMEREAETIKVLHSLRALGVGLAIDDFGTGYSSLAYLKSFPVDKLKIDKAFIGDIPSNEDDKQITAAIVAMAHSLRLKVLAEGVETEDQLAFLQQHACDYYQGYYLSPALPAGAFTELLRKNAGLTTLTSAE